MVTFDNNSHIIEDVLHVRPHRFVVGIFVEDDEGGFGLAGSLVYPPGIDELLMSRHLPLKTVGIAEKDKSWRLTVRRTCRAPVSFL